MAFLENFKIKNIKKRNKYGIIINKVRTIKLGDKSSKIRGNMNKSGGN